MKSNLFNLYFQHKHHQDHIHAPVSFSAPLILSVSYSFIWKSDLWGFLGTAELPSNTPTSHHTPENKIPSLVVREVELKRNCSKKWVWSLLRGYLKVFICTLFVVVGLSHTSAGHELTERSRSNMSIQRGRRRRSDNMEGKQWPGPGQEASDRQRTAFI